MTQFLILDIASRQVDLVLLLVLEPSRQALVVSIHMHVRAWESQDQAHMLIDASLTIELVSMRELSSPVQTVLVLSAVSAAA